MQAKAVKARGTWRGPAADSVALGYEDRHRRRIAMTGAKGLAFLLDLPETMHLREGDGLVLDDGRIVEVRAKPEGLLEIRGRDQRHLAKLAWHLGNRHLAAQIDHDRILIRRDHVIAHMLEHLGAQLREVVEPFDPESGAYALGHDHDH
jgi:urease accessory protein